MLKIYILLYQLTFELLLYLIHDNVDFTLFYCVRLKLDSRFNWGINSDRSNCKGDNNHLIFAAIRCYNNYKATMNGSDTYEG